MEGNVFPSLLYLLKVQNLEKYPGLIVDRGASLALTRGADLMAPGVRSVQSSFDAGEVVIALDEELNKPVAVLKALMPSSQIEELVRSRGKGKVAKNLHRPKALRTL